MFVQIGRSKLHYRVYGGGEQVVLAFHGYGQDHSHFYNMSAALPLAKIIAFDLFFHGQSVLHKTDTPLRKEFLAQLILPVLEEQQITRFSLMAFSMGGKFALALLEAFSDEIDQVLLIAPDGISTSFWYNVATYPGWLQGLFKRTVIQPARFFKFINWLDSTRLVDPGLTKFAAWQMNSTQKRLRVYRSWMGFRTLTFDIRKIVRLLNSQQIKFILFLGEYDQVISGKRLQVFARSIQNCQLILLKTGHTFLLHEVASYLRRHPGVF
ncbi:alpha/beta hydrolase [Adhaeribacter arboris]|uniref:Alpha/beta hydrolase n=1 Tax=Adhaeribacter arboris TaxID=2072846 RepID=A0A2T2Y9B1_9BACT|nr:alpha/beta hydrolase [Adhaeribacter arboris]PSR52104.1 alpha/beta hydrolase [Adhaeribacter arboris]